MPRGSLFRSADDSTIAMGSYSEAIVVFIMHLGQHFLTMIIWALGGCRNGNGRKRKDILDIFE